MRLIMWLFFLALASVFVLLRLLSEKTYKKIADHGIKFLQPQVLFGNLLKIILGHEHISAMLKNLYDYFPEERYVCVFEFLHPAIVIRDPDLINQIGVESFNQFHDVPLQIDEGVDSMCGRTLPALKGEKWRQTRARLSPIFAPSKLVKLNPLIQDCAARYVDYFRDRSSTSGSMRVNMKDISARFTNDVIATTAFGLEIDSLKDRQNQFYTSARQLTNHSWLSMVKLIGFRSAPKIMKKLGLKMFPDSTTSHLHDLMLDIIKMRETSGQQRQDLIQLLIESKKTSLKYGDNDERFKFAHDSTYEWTDDDLAVLAITFILAGYHKMSTALSFTLYELAVNPDVQKRLQDEIDSVLRGNEGRFKTDSIEGMKYLDMVISEALRKWPTLPVVNRLCAEPFSLGRTNDVSYTVNKGDSVWFPIQSIHMDSNYWDNPDKFDPERFSDVNRTNIKPQTYLPFGLGPRCCIGGRFAQIQMKTIVVYLLASFDFEPCPKTMIPINLSTKSLFMDSKDGFWLDMKLRRDSLLV